MRTIKFRGFDPINNKIIPWEGMAGWAITGLESPNIMQFTGLLDRHGKEIYEGDIVKCSSGCPHKIIWVHELGGAFIGGMPGWYLSGLHDGYAWTDTEEIIGNIYENPELL